MATPGWLAAIERLAPTVASAFGTPVAGMAVSALEAALGITGGDGSSTDKIQAAIEKGQLTGDQIAAMKKADQEFAAKMKELDVDLEKMQLVDVEGARQMQISQPSMVPAALSIFVTAGFFACLGAMLAGVDVTDNNAFLIMLGSLGTGWATILQFWFGSTRHSQNTATLNAQAVAAAAGK